MFLSLDDVVGCDIRIKGECTTTENLFMVETVLKTDSNEKSARTAMKNHVGAELIQDE